MVKYNGNLSLPNGLPGDPPPVPPEVTIYYQRMQEESALIASDPGAYSLEIVFSRPDIFPAHNTPWQEISSLIFGSD